MKKEENCSALQRKPCPFLFPHPGCVHADPTQNAKLIKIKKEPGPTVKKKRRPEDHFSWHRKRLLSCC